MMVMMINDEEKHKDEKKLKIERFYNYYKIQTNLKAEEKSEDKMQLQLLLYLPLTNRIRAGWPRQKNKILGQKIERYMKKLDDQTNT